MNPGRIYMPNPYGSVPLGWPCVPEKRGCPIWEGRSDFLGRCGLRLDQQLVRAHAGSSQETETPERKQVGLNAGTGFAGDIRAEKPARGH